MRIVVCAKQVPAPDVPVAFDPVSGLLVRDGAVVLDDADAVGVELGLRLVAAAGDGAGDGEVVLVSMAPRGELAGLRTGLAMGASRAVLVSDEALAGCDALSTAKVLARVVVRLGSVDLIVSGALSTDGYTGVMAAQMAELLGLPVVSFSRRVEVEGGVLKAERLTADGYDEVECPLPCVVTVTGGAVQPRYPSYRGIVGARTKPVEVLSVDALGLAASEVGWAGARQEIVGVEAVEARAAGEVVEDDDGQGAERILELLVRLKLV